MKDFNHTAEPSDNLVLIQPTLGMIEAGAKVIEAHFDHSMNYSRLVAEEVFQEMISFAMLSNPIKK